MEYYSRIKKYIGTFSVSFIQHDKDICGDKAKMLLSPHFLLLGKIVKILIFLFVFMETPFLFQ